MQRRVLLTALCSSVASLSSSCAMTNKVFSPSSEANHKAIDLEHHFLSQAFLQYLTGRKNYPYFDEKIGIVFNKTAAFPAPKNQAFFNPPYPIFDELTDIDTLKVKIMDECGFSHVVLSSIIGIEMLPKEDCVRIAKATNDEIAAAVKKHPDRFYGTFCLPSPYIEESLKEIDRAVDVLGLKYWHTHSNYGSMTLDDKRYEPIFKKLAEKDIAFYVHPAYPVTPYLLDTGLAFSAAGFGFGADTMKTTIRLFLSGLFDRYPNLKMIMGHMAEFYPYIIDRMDNRFAATKYLEADFNKMQHGFEYYFKRGNVFMTTSGIFNPKVALFAIEKFGADRVMLGTDYPCEKFKASREFVENLPISNEDKEKILFRNAEKYILKV